MSAGSKDRGRKARERAGAVNGDGNGHESIDQAMMKALSNPVRVEILGLLCREGEMSPSKISACLDQPLSVVSYHVKVLSADCDLLELVKEVPRRGATEHFYRSKLEGVDPRIASFQASISKLLDAVKRGAQ